MLPLVLIGCGLRREEVTALTVAHLQQREGCFVKGRTMLTAGAIIELACHLNFTPSPHCFIIE